MKSKKVNKPNKTNKKREEIIMFEIDSWIIEMEKIYSIISTQNKQNQKWKKLEILMNPSSTIQCLIPKWNPHISITIKILPLISLLTSMYYFTLFLDHLF